MIKISILIPVYNVEKYLTDCLESVINQTEKNIEIICVEDASTDCSARILKEYEDKDSRIHVIYHEQNEGLCKTRKDGVMKAQGEYIMFLDSDDFLSLDACEILYREIQRKKVDVLQFGTELLYGENVSEEMAKWVDNFMKPTEERIEKENLLKACFVERKLNCNLVNKIWKTVCCKQGFSYVDDGKYFSAEDRYAAFLILYFANSSDGIMDIFYHYRLGVGVTGGAQLDLARFHERCKGAIISQKIKTFLMEKGFFSDLNLIYTAFANDILWDCVDCWYNKLGAAEYKEGFRILLKYWTPGEIVGALGKTFFEKQQEIEKRVDYAGGAVIAIYYRYIGYDAMEMILEKYLSFYESRGYKVIFITDMDAPEKENEYMGHKLFTIFSATDANWGDYSKRCKELENILKEQSVKEVCYISPTSHVVDFDQLVIESMGIDFKICMDEYTQDKASQKDKELNMLTKKMEETEKLYNDIVSKKSYKIIKKLQQKIHW